MFFLYNDGCEMNHEAYVTFKYDLIHFLDKLRISKTGTNLSL